MSQPTCNLQNPRITQIEEPPLRIRKHSGRDFELDVAVAVPPGITILFGPSGAGKTTTLDCIAGLLQPDEGRIATREHVLFDSAAGINLPPQLRKVGYVFQDLALFPHLTVQGNVEYGLSRLPRELRQSAAQPSWNHFASPICGSAGPVKFPGENGRESHWPAPW